MKLILVTLFILGISCEKSDSEKIYANVNGKEIYGKEFLPEIKSKLEKAKSENEKVAIISKKLDDIVTDKIIEYETQRTGQSREELFKFFDFLKQRELDGEEIEQYTKKFDLQFKDIKSKNQLIEAIHGHQYKRAKELYIQLLRSKASIEVYPTGKP